MPGYESHETPSAAAFGPEAPVPADPSWTPLEGWVWQKLQVGAIANIDNYGDDRGPLPLADPRKPEDWPDGRRRISASFLEAILLQERFCGALHRKGVRIEAAWFDQEIDLEMAELTCVLWLDRCRFEACQKFGHLKAGSDVTFDHSVFVNRLDLQGACVGGNFFLRHVTAFDDVNLRTSRIEGLAYFVGAKIGGVLDMNGVNVGKGLLLHSIRAPFGGDAEFNEVNLVGAKISGQLNLNGVTVTKMLAIGGATIDHDLFISSDSTASQRQAQFGEISLRSIRVRGQLAMVGVKVTGTVDIGRAKIGQDLLMCTDLNVSGHRAIYKDVDLRGAEVHGQVELTATQIGGKLIMNSAHIEQSLLMSSSLGLRAEFNSVSLQGAFIRGSMVLNGAKVEDTLDASICEIGQTLDMGSADRTSVYCTELSGVLLQGAKIGGQLSLAGAKVASTLDLDSVKIGRGLFLNYDPEISPAQPEFHDVLLARAKIEGTLGLRGAIVKGLLVAESSRIDGPVFLENCEISGGASFLAASIGGDVLLGGATLSHLDLHGARICGELNFAPPPPQWRCQDGMKSRLNLRNATCDAVQDGSQADAWPEQVELDGFTYRRFGGLGADAGTDVAERGSKWFVDWLARDKPFTRQPYHHCASVLRELGHPEMANDVLYAGREREREQAWRSGNNSRGIGLTLLNWLIGYGYGLRYFRSLWWVGGFVLLGTLVLFFSSEIDEVGGSFLPAAFYSFDLLLPIIELYKPHYEIVLDGLAKYYFAFHKLMGYVLASFLIAGLAGLAK